MKLIKIGVLCLICLSLIFTTACSNAEDVATEKDNYYWVVTCPEIHNEPFYAMIYSWQGDTLILHEAYIYEGGWKKVTIYKYPTDVAVSITLNSERRGGE